VEESHADREDLVEAAVSQTQILEASHEELGFAGRDVLLVSA
jgi:hypothetical protein